MYYVYILRSQKDGNFYVGYTADLRKRIGQHNKGIVESTRNRRPFELIYYEACIKQQDALHREKYLKSAYGKRYIKNRLKEYLHALD
jgi:putative endonuclease